MLAEKENLKIAVACPSYRRPICQTAKFYPEVKIYVDKSEADEYRKANASWGGVVIECPDGVQGNLPRVRNYILDTEFENGADIVLIMDDDVQFAGYFTADDSVPYGYIKRKFDAEGFRDFLIKGSILCDEWGFGLWSVNLTDMPLLYEHYQPFNTTAKLTGQFMCFVKNDLRFDENLPLKEDCDMGVQQCLKYRGYLRINYAFIHAETVGSNTGGTACRRNFDSEFEQWKLFRNKWGSDIVVGTSKKAGCGNGCGTKDHEHGGFMRKYDFSHPTIKIPIKGV